MERIANIQKGWSQLIQIEMKMPDNCNQCPFVDSEFEYCHAADGAENIPPTLDTNVMEHSYRGTKPDWCPLQEVI